ncbi:site-specific integrase [Fodinicurvata sp. EGI_FJ10296]|uniref:tyrosine-type recombinase/integrase n=1 Tax=Fodinicurvata sp. EGI_FJ10296 TaxID=3231908 RepID=UPI003453156D
MTLDEAFGRYWIEIAHRQSSASDTERQSGVILKILGGGTNLDKVNNAAVARMVAELRGKMSDSSANRHTELLRRVLRRARDIWEAQVSMPDWKSMLLQEPAPRDRTLSESEEFRLLNAIRQDFRPMILFALLAGVRVSNARTLTWRQVDLDAAVISFKVKSRRPGGETHTLPISNEIRAILSRERGRHDTYVFTYECAKNRHDPKRGKIQKKGERRPFTRDGWRREWRRALATADIEDFRFHDLRHTFGTRMLRQTGNLRLVQRLLGHRDIQSTLRYANSDLNDARAAMEAMSRTRHADDSTVDKDQKESTG